MSRSPGATAIRGARTVPGGGLLRGALLGLVVAGATACQGGSQVSSTTTFVLTTVDASSSGTSAEASSGTTAGSSSTTAVTAEASSSATARTSGSSSDASTTLVNDVGWDTEVSDTKPLGCKGKIDFLFVMSGEYKFGAAQAQMIDAFPKFISTIEAKFADFDYHIMVVEADDSWGDDACDELCGQPECKIGDPCCPPSLPGEVGESCSCVDWVDYPCDLLDQVTACDDTIGAGIVFPAGRGSSNKPCKIANGRRYMTNEEPDLLETFACVAQTGVWDDSQVGDALVAAVGPEINAPGGCNEGFLRDDALLMMTLVTRTVDHSKKVIYPWDWYDAVVAAKNGDPSSVIALVIGNAECPFPEDYSCQLAKMFEHHVIVEIDEPDYGPAFDTATDLVAVACEDFIPQ